MLTCTLYSTILRRSFVAGVAAVCIRLAVNLRRDSVYDRINGCVFLCAESVSPDIEVSISFRQISCGDSHMGHRCRKVYSMSLASIHCCSCLSKHRLLQLCVRTNSPLILVRYSLLHFHLSHMAVHHHLFRHLHYHLLHLLLLAQSFILNLRLGFSANHFRHRPFPFLPA